MVSDAHEKTFPSPFVQKTINLLTATREGNDAYEEAMCNSHQDYWRSVIWGLISCGGVR
jgi:hypothetical protein